MRWQQALREALFLGLAAVALGAAAHRWLAPSFSLSLAPARLHDLPVIQSLPRSQVPADTAAYLGLRPTLAWLQSSRARAVAAVPVQGLAYWNPDSPETWVGQVLQSGADTGLWILADTALFYQRAWRLQRLLRSLGITRAWVTAVPADSLARLLAQQRTP